MSVLLTFEMKFYSLNFSSHVFFSSPVNCSTKCFCIVSFHISLEKKLVHFSNDLTFIFLAQWINWIIHRYFWTSLTSIQTQIKKS